MTRAMRTLAQSHRGGTPRPTFQRPFRSGPGRETNGSIAAGRQHVSGEADETKRRAGADRQKGANAVGRKLSVPRVGRKWLMGSGMACELG